MERVIRAIELIVLLVSIFPYFGMMCMPSLNGSESFSLVTRPVDKAVKFETTSIATQLRLDAVFIVFVKDLQLRASLRDGDGHPIANATIDFSLLFEPWRPTSGWYPIGSSITDADGFAERGIGLGIFPGNYSARARHESGAGFGASEDIVGFEVPNPREIHISSDGSIEPPDTPIRHSGNIYTLTDNIIGDFDGITIELDNMILDGAGYMIQNTHLRAVPLWGIALFDRTNVTIKSVQIKSCICGICVSYSSNNTLMRNRIIGSTSWIGSFGPRCGLYLEDSLNNSILENEVADNRQELAIELRSSVNNRIIHNSFLNDTRDNIFTVNSTNIWDDGYPSGGNYWGGYTCLDSFGGFYQNSSGSDGIADAPYIIDASNRDNYPLTKPYGGPFDIGVTNVAIAKAVVGKNCNLNGSFKITNYGINTETFNVTFFVNKTATTMFQGITLASRSSATFEFTWNASVIDFGSYTITAYAGPVQNETDISDNKCTSCIIRVSIVGDVNGDGIVDLRDLYMLSKTCGVSLDCPKWNPNYDVNNDGTIDLRDFYMACRNFGKGC